jgi:ACS family tartrate transporter-like MFS transporter
LSKPAGRPLKSLGEKALAKVAWRVLPLLGLGYGLSYVDRLNISFAALQMNADLKFNGVTFGTGAGLFFLTYATCGIPSNLMLLRLGARRWLGMIMIVWGAASAALIFVRAPWQFYILRLILGAAEAGFFPGAVHHLDCWFPSSFRARAISGFYVSFPIANALMGITAAAILNLGGFGGLKGWQWLFLIEGLPAIVLGVAILMALPDHPATALWLNREERDWIQSRQSVRLADQLTARDALRAIAHPLVLMLSIADFLILGTNYGFSFTAPLLLRDAHVGLTSIGVLFAISSSLGIIALFATAWYSDTHGDRLSPAVLMSTVNGLGFLLLGLVHEPAASMIAFAIIAISNFALQGVLWALPEELIEGPGSAISLATVVVIGMLGPVATPILWGVLHDQMQSYRPALLLSLPLMLIAAGLLKTIERHWRKRPSATSA